MQNPPHEGMKISFDPLLHSTKNDMLPKMKQVRVERKDQRKQHYRKKRKKDKDYTRDYHELLLENLPKEYYSTKSPHLLINRRWFKNVRKNTIMLKNVREYGTGRDRIIHYDIDQIGDDIRFNKKCSEWILNPSTTISNTIFIMVRLSDMKNVEKIQYHTEIGHMINNCDLNTTKDQCYVLLSIIKVDKQTQNLPPIISKEDLPLMKRYFINQISAKKGNYHFDTSGTIYGLGYGPKSNRNTYGHSVCKFSNRKYHIVNFLFNLISF